MLMSSTDMNMPTITTTSGICQFTGLASAAGAAGTGGAGGTGGSGMGGAVTTDDPDVDTGGPRFGGKGPSDAARYDWE
ncbi:hypothetical protein GCM10023321_37120 [Pseudonocardia eucalypti]|uniref:Uncharacterized protein n=1 Tax=Pseudonocardia eucalypti TaxID=648755 RepID=A0ABP9Q7P2_9PSEU